MKKLIALSFALATVTISVSAQQKRDISKLNSSTTHASHQEERHERMKDLNLSDAQREQMKSIRKDKSLSREDKRTKMNSVFTTEQKKRLLEKRAGMDGKDDAKGEKRGRELEAKLGLNKDQAMRLKAVSDEHHAKMKALKDNQNLSADARKAQMKALHESAMAQRKLILTTEQLRKMDAMKKAGRGNPRSEKEDK